MIGSGTHYRGPINQLKQMVCHRVRKEFTEKKKQGSLVAYHYPWFASVSTYWALAAAKARGKCKRERVKGPLT